MLPKIIAFTGQMGSGKTTCASIAHSIIPNSRIIKFAGPIYELQATIYKACGLPQIPKDRELLQTLGLWGRNKSENFWVDQWVKEVKDVHDFSRTVVICDDLRFDNEAKKIKELGGKIIKVEASREARANRIKLINEGDVSEKGISNSFIDFTINNDNVTESDLKYTLSRILSQCHGGFNGN